MDVKYTHTSFLLAKVLTYQYSTSFSIATRLFPKDIREAIFALYGFVRIADEVVDSHHGVPQEETLHSYEHELNSALSTGVSTNPLLHAFATVVRNYKIPYDLIASFLESMRKDITEKTHTTDESITQYIYGSADVVGLMCLWIFCRGDAVCYEKLQHYARKLGSAFQKVNFLRDLHYDTTVLKRNYFPILATKDFTEEVKHTIIKDIENDFSIALEGIRKLPRDVRLPVYVAYTYYTALLKKLSRTPAETILKSRVRISDIKKLLLLGRAWFCHAVSCI